MDNINTINTKNKANTYQTFCFLLPSFFIQIVIPLVMYVRDNRRTYYDALFCHLGNMIKCFGCIVTSKIIFTPATTPSWLSVFIGEAGEKRRKCFLMCLHGCGTDGRIHQGHDFFLLHYRRGGGRHDPVVIVGSHHQQRCNRTAG